MKKKKRAVEESYSKGCKGIRCTGETLGSDPRKQGNPRKQGSDWVSSTVKTKKEKVSKLSNGLDLMRKIESKSESDYKIFTLGE